MKHLAIFVASDFEDTELIAALDIFNRNEISYTLFSVENLYEVRGKYEAFVKTTPITEFKDEYKGIFLPGGPGHKILLQSLSLREIIRLFDSQGKVIAAICAATDVLIAAGIISNQIITSYPGHAPIATNTQNEVEVDKNIITGRDFKATISFAQEVVHVLKTK